MIVSNRSTQKIVMMRIEDDPEEYWLNRGGTYPHMTTRRVGLPDVNACSHYQMFGYYIVCIFDGVAHWGFQDWRDLETFNKEFPDEQGSN